MCGICGIYNIHEKRPINGGVVDAMLKVIRHRGPDGENKYITDRVALGFNRLGFIDLKNGMQPLFNEDKQLALVCNGEIYNHAELRTELKTKGHEFRTGSDVEVILHLYEEYGVDFPKYLNGQFAIALYDGHKEEMMLVRDQVGICPLFYTVTDGRVIFASEIKGILEYPGVERKLNLKAVDQLMNFPGVVSPNTFFENVYSLKAGHMLLFSPEREPVETEYWDLLYSPEEEEDKGEAYYTERLRELLKTAIERRLIAEYPVGFYVSGGLDSSLVACNIGKYRMDSRYSFSAEIGSGDLDESRFQKMVKEVVNSHHYVTKVGEKEIWKHLPDVIYHAEGAVKESYDVAAYLLSELVNESPARAVLTGQGSDEYFCGYVGYMVDLFRNMQKGQMTKEECEMNEMLWGDPYFRYERNHSEIRDIHAKLYHKDIRGEHSKFAAWKESPIDVNKVKNLSTQRRRSYIDNKLRLSDHLLTEHGDRMFMAHSVEGRHPFLDAEVIRFVTTMPDKYKLKGVNEKYILKKAGEGIVPEPILKRKKFPFQAPGMSALIKKAEGMPYLSEEITKRFGVFDWDYIKELKQIYSQEDFKLMGAYEIDYLLIVMTVHMLCERYSLTL